MRSVRSEHIWSPQRLGPGVRFRDGDPHPFHPSGVCGPSSPNVNADCSLALSGSIGGQGLNVLVKVV